MKVYHRVPKLWALAFVLASVAVLFRVNTIRDHLRLSLLSSTVLHEDLERTPASAFSPPFFTQNIARSPDCPTAIAEIDTESMSGMLEASRQRLMRYISLACEDDQHIIARFDREVAGGYNSTAMDALYIGEVLRRSGQVDRAVKLQQMNPIVSLWYVNLGRIAIEQMHNEPAALVYFQLANTIEPNFGIEKAPLYLYMCLASIRDNKTYVLEQPCDDFDRVKRTSASRLYLGRSSYNRGDFGQALTYLTDAINLGDVSGDAYYWKGKAFAALGRVSEAEDAFQMGVAEVPEYPWSYLDLAKLKASEGCYLTARNYLQKMQALQIEGATTAAQAALQALEPYSMDRSSCP
jgi:tetratricopeptide (TPR) repeat protein